MSPEVFYEWLGTILRIFGLVLITIILGLGVIRIAIEQLKDIRDTLRRFRGIAPLSLVRTTCPWCHSTASQPGWVDDGSGFKAVACPNEFHTQPNAEPIEQT